MLNAMLNLMSALEVYLANVVMIESLEIFYPVPVKSVLLNV